MQSSNLKLSSVLGFGLSLSTAWAAPSILDRASGFSSVCTDIYISSSWLVGTCPTTDGSANITSSVFLPDLVTNSEATLEWKVQGAYAASCSSCVLTDSGATLYCYCDSTYASNNKDTFIDLEEHVLVYDGYLLSDLDGEPTVPTSSSSVPIPANFNFAFNIYGETDEACSAVYASSDTTSTPYACFAFEEVPGGDPFYAFKNTINDGWQFTGYADDACSGDPVVQFDYTNDSCIAVPEGVIGMSLLPLWNAFYYPSTLN